MQLKKIIVWDLPTRVGHWMLAIAFVVAYVTAESERWRLVHVLSGSAVAAIVVFRLVWGFVGSRYARFSEFLTTPRRVVDYTRSYMPGANTGARYIGHNPAGGWSVVLLLISTGLAAVTGLLAYHFPDTNRVGAVHEWLANAAIALVLVHLLGVAVSSFMHNENLIAAMFTGQKLGGIGQGIASTHMRAAIVMVVWVVMLMFLLS